MCCDDAGAGAGVQTSLSSFFQIQFLSDTAAVFFDVISLAGDLAAPKRHKESDMGVGKATVYGDVDPLQGESATDNVDTIPNRGCKDHAFVEFDCTDDSANREEGSADCHDRHEGVELSLP